MDFADICPPFEIMENGPNVRSMKTVRIMWEELFDVPVMESFRKEEDEELTKMMMLLKTAYTKFKMTLIESRIDGRKLKQELQSEKRKTATLEEEIERLKNEMKTKIGLSEEVSANAQVKTEIISLQEANFKIPATNTKNTTSSKTSMDLGITPLPANLLQNFAKVKVKDLGIKPLAELKTEKQDAIPSTSNIQEITRTLPLNNKDISFDMDIDINLNAVQMKSEESSKKRLSSESEEAAVKKVKVDSFFVPDTPLDYEYPKAGTSSFFVPATLNESQDPFSETLLLEPTISDVESPKTPPQSPILTASPKSPIILTARTRRNLFENQSPSISNTIANISNVSFSLIPSSPGTNVKTQSLNSPSLLKSATKHSTFSPLAIKNIPKQSKSSPSPAKPVLNKLTIISSTSKNNQKQTLQNSTPNESNSNQLLSKPSPDKNLPTYTLSPAKASTKQNLPPSAAKHGSSLIKCSPKKVEVNGKENKFKAELEARPRVVSSYLNGRSKLEVNAADKSKKTPKLKQSKLSLSMFHSKKPVIKKLSDDEMLKIALEESTKPQNETQREEELLQLALAESMKTVNKPADSKQCDPNAAGDNIQARSSLDPDATYFERPEGSLTDPNKTLFESAKEVESFQTFCAAFEDEREVKQDDKCSGKQPSSGRQKKSSFLDVASFHEMNNSDIGQFFTDFEEDKPQEEDNLQQVHENGPTENLKEGEFRVPKPLNSMEKEYFKGYDKVPEKQKPGPSYVYQAGPVRKKIERQQLPGWECHECKTFCNVLCHGMNSQEKREAISKCSRHRQQAPLIGNTPPGIWEIGLLQSPEGLTQEGELHVKKHKDRRIDKAVAVTQTPNDDMI